MRAAVLICAMGLATVGSTSAKQPTKKLTCAAAQGIKTEAEFTAATGQDTSIVNVAFIGKRPLTREIDRVLRDCVRAAAKIDARQDILGTAWIRRSASDDPLDDEILDIYGALSYLSYQARTKTVEVRQMNFKGK